MQGAASRIVCAGLVLLALAAGRLEAQQPMSQATIGVSVTVVSPPVADTLTGPTALAQIALAGLDERSPAVTADVRTAASPMRLGAAQASPEPRRKPRVLVAYTGV